MFLLSDLGLKSLNQLEKLLQKDSSVKIHRGHGEHCIYIQPSPKYYDEGLNFIQTIYNWLCMGFYPGLRVVNVFQRYDLNTLKICLNDNHTFYQCMIQCFDEHCQRSRPYED